MFVSVRHARETYESHEERHCRWELNTGEIHAAVFLKEDIVRKKKKFKMSLISPSLMQAVS